MADTAHLTSPIAVGRTAEIFAWEDGHILKLTRPAFPAHLADQEWRNARLAWELGVPVPRPIEILDVAGRRGVVFERCDGPTMAQAIRRSMWRIAAYGRQLARIHAAVHAAPAHHKAVRALPSYHDRVAWNLERATLLPDALKAQVRPIVARLPDGEALCHADFHPENILLTEKGPVVIDWEGCLHGDPVADVAATCLWIRAALNFDTGLRGWLRRRLGQRFEHSYRTEYERQAPHRLARLDTWIGIQAACRADEEHRDQISHLLALVEQACAAALDA
jgi:aminoglycoside phosphotransferase (APT) family kinase protein